MYHMDLIIQGELPRIIPHDKEKGFYKEMEIKGTMYRVYSYAAWVCYVLLFQHVQAGPGRVQYNLVARFLACSCHLHRQRLRVVPACSCHAV